MSNSGHSALLVAVISLGTILLRFLPFLIFNGKRKVPSIVSYLQDVLPGAVLGMLVVYCLRDINIMHPLSAGKELLACAVVAGLQLWRRNSLLSILGGTAVYMLL